MIDNKIQVAFCFDSRVLGPAYVSIASLLDFKLPGEHFDIHCVVDEHSMKKREELQNIVRRRDVQSSIYFYQAPNTFERAYETRGISTATYLRFMLHTLLPQIDKVLYLDTDILVRTSLKKLWETDISDYYFAGVKGTNNFADKWDAYAEFDYYDELEGLRGKYINAGVLLMNLKRIKETGIEAIWLEKARKNYEYQDQDIINITCKEQILCLPLKYNLAAYLIPKWYKKYYIQGIYSKEECMDAYRHPVILHFAGDKPWNNRNAHRADAWWDYVLSQEELSVLFDKKKKNYLTRLINRIK